MKNLYFFFVSFFLFFTNTLQNKSAQLKLFNMAGKQIRTFNTNGASTILDLNDLAKGIYSLQLVGEHVNLVHRVVVH